MADIDIANICYAVLGQKMDREREILASGKLSSFESYRHHVGRLQSLQEAEDEIKDAFRKRYDDED